MKEFVLEKNAFLDCDVRGLYHAEWHGQSPSKNPSFIYKLKNDPHHRWSQEQLRIAANELCHLLQKDLPQISEYVGNRPLTVCVVPRAKKESFYCDDQLLFKKVVSFCVQRTAGFVDGTSFIKRVENTFTTHLKNPMEGFINDGRKPYPGIALDSCVFSDQIKGRDILLIDDIYTKTSNIDEDMVQALFEQGARSVIFYAIGYTVFRNKR